MGQQLWVDVLKRAAHEHKWRYLCFLCSCGCAPSVMSSLSHPHRHTHTAVKQKVAAKRVPALSNSVFIKCEALCFWIPPPQFIILPRQMWLVITILQVGSGCAWEIMASCWIQLVEGQAERVLYKPPVVFSSTVIPYFMSGVGVLWEYVCYNLGVSFAVIPLIQLPVGKATLWESSLRQSCSPFEHHKSKVELMLSWTPSLHTKHPSGCSKSQLT